MTDHPSLDAAGAERAARKGEAQRALLAWQESVWSSLTGLMSVAGVAPGQDVVAVFTSGEDGAAAASPADWMVGEHLADVVFAAPGRHVRLAVEVPPGLVIDVDRRTVYAYERWYLPEYGNDPDLLLELEHPDDLELDPFASFLQAAARDEDALDRRLAYLLDLHQLQPPTEPSDECDSGTGSGETGD